MPVTQKKTAKLSVADVESEVRDNKKTRTAIMRVLVKDFSKELLAHLEIVPRSLKPVKR
jgi:hypothetical protein